jgi:hypothetical protein
MENLIEKRSGGSTWKRWMVGSRSHPEKEMNTLCDPFTPAAEGHGPCPWMNVPASGRDVAPLEREEGCHGLWPWGSTNLIAKINYFG